MPRSRSFTVLLRYLGPLWPRVLLLACLLFGSIGLTLFTPQIVAHYIDSAQHGGLLSTLYRYGVQYLFAAIGIQLLSSAATYVGADLGWRATNRLRTDLMAHLLALDMNYHKERTPGEMIERIDGDVTALSNFFSQFSVQVFGAMLLLLGALVIFWRENVWVGLGVTVFAAVTLGAMQLTRKAGVEPTRQEREASAGLYGFIEERLNGLDDVRALGAGQHTLRNFLGVQGHFFRKSLYAWRTRSVVWRLSILLFAIGYVGILAAAVGLYAAGAITLGSAYALYSYMALIEAPIDQLSQQLQELQKAGASLIRVGELFNLSSALHGGERELPSGAASLNIENLDFAYEGAPVLEGLNLQLAAGRTLGLLGRTGSGKTTLTRLVSRLYDPTNGRITLGGQDLRDLKLQNLRLRVAVVTQDVQLFQASVRDNLTFFDPSVPDSQVEAALHEVGLSDWLDSLENGVRSPLPAGSLSAGEAQLLAFARVMLRDPALIILDEPSSRLDPATEARLTQAMTRLLSGRSAIVIAHRLDTVARADDILVLGEGRILEHGERARLARNPHSHYAALLRAGQDHSRDLEEVLA